MNTSNLSQLSERLQKLKKNREGIQQTDLPKYQKALTQLENRIMDLHKETFLDIVFSGLLIDNKDESDLQKAGDVMRDILEEQGKQIAEECKQALLGKYDLNAYILVGLRVQCEFERRFYMDYWISHVKVLGGIFYNDLIDMWYDEDYNLWEDSEYRFRISYPPIREDYKKDLDDREKQICEELQQVA